MHNEKEFDYILELHDSQIERVTESEGIIEIVFSSAWLHPRKSVYQPDYQPVEDDRPVRLVFKGAKREGDWPDFEEDSYISTSDFVIDNSEYHDIPVPAHLTEKLMVKVEFILGEAVTIHAEELISEIVSLAS